MFKNITVAVDGSDHANRAIQIACDLAKHYDGQIHLVHTPEVPTTGMAVGYGAVEIPPSVEAIAEAGKVVMADATKAVQDTGLQPASTFVRHGAAATETVAVAEETKSDLIVAGRRGRGSVASLVLGSTSLQIAHDAPCAFMTVK